VVLEAGGYITKPRGEVHAMWNAGSTPARMIEIISPAGLEKFFRDIADLFEAGRPPTMQDMAVLAGNYGVRGRGASMVARFDQPVQPQHVAWR
jgi:hypothetical protein